MEPIAHNAALIVIDVQEGWSHPKWGQRNNLHAEDNIVSLLAAWRGTGRPVIHVRHISRNPGSVFALDGPGSVLKAKVAPIDGEAIIRKHQNSSFIGTDLEERLRSAEIENVVIVGLTTDHCVSTTARMAANLGFKTIFVGDATATFERTGPAGQHFTAEQMHDVNVASLHGEFATVVDTADVLVAVGASASVAGTRV
jgi:nicotinamidase-related amidase